MDTGAVISAPGHAIRVSDHCVEAWSRSRLPFQPKGDAIEFRNALRGTLAELALPTGHRLHTTYASLLPDFCDAENVLFYNLGMSHVRHLMRYGVGLNRGYSMPTVPDTACADRRAWRPALGQADGQG